LLTLIIAESALEPIPEHLWMHPSIQRHAKKYRKSPRFVLLDRSYHYAAMRRLEHNEKRGRPDIVNFALLEALGSPLNKEGLLKVYVHTIGNHVISIDSATRLPKNCNRFVSLIEQLFEYERVPPQLPKKTLLTLEHKTLSQLIHKVKPSYVLAFSRTGKLCTLEEAVARISGFDEPLVIVGGFPHGHFSEATIRLANDVIAVDPEMMEACTVISRIIYEFERANSLPEKRLNQKRWRFK
jgi:rRNA small subunit pseudouridine methyltransferase Nep1